MATDDIANGDIINAMFADDLLNFIILTVGNPVGGSIRLMGWQQLMVQNHFPLPEPRELFSLFLKILIDEVRCRCLTGDGLGNGQGMGQNDDPGVLSVLVDKSGPLLSVFYSVSRSDRRIQRVDL